jgi:hypothetical protein
LRVSSVFGYLEALPKQFNPIGRSSTFAIGKTLNEGKPGYGICVPEIISGIKARPVDSSSSTTLTADDDPIMSGRPIFLFGDSTVSVQDIS